MIKIISNLIFIFVFTLNLSFHSESDKHKKNLQKINLEKHYSRFNINNISTYVYNHGGADLSPLGNSGFAYPKGSGKMAIYESGVVWGGKINNEIRVGGSTYNHGLRPGKILPNGIAEDPAKESVRVFRVRPDYKTANLSSEINDGEGTEEEIRTQYKLDWNEWPANDGAPFDDLDNDGIYNPQKDIPGIIGADQTLWFVANDLDSNVTKELYGSLPMGIEMQVTVWGYANRDVLNNMFFKKYKLINKSNTVFDSMYISIWSDPDLGGAGDDFVGCDTLLNLAYVYNGTQIDAVYNDTPPSVGFMLLQGPLVDGTSKDVGRINNKEIKGKKNLQATSITRLLKNFNSGFDDPRLQNYEKGTIWFWNLLKGLDVFGIPMLNPITESFTKYSVPGDPTSNTGWIDGGNYSHGDRRIMISSGPFTMAVGDTQEVIFAEIVAGGKEGIDRLEAVKLLKNYCLDVKKNYNSYFNLFLPISIQKVKALELDKEIIFSWYDDENLELIESYNNLNFNFQGYTLYQFPVKNATIEEAKEVLTYDIIDGKTKITTREGKSGDNIIVYPMIKSKFDSGIKRHISIKKDLFNSDKPLNNGTEYHFGLVSYALSEKYKSYPNLIESIITKFTAIPQSEKPGTVINSKYGDTLKVIHTNGNSSIKIKVVIVNPFEITGKTYRITFERTADTNSINYKNYLWSLLDEENNILVDRNKIITNNKLGLTKPIIVDGFQIEPFVVSEFQANSLTEYDEYTFVTPKNIIDNMELAQKDIQKINVYPNPYYCTHNNEVDQYLKYVTFNHLPRKAIIRIYNIAGHLIRTLYKNDETQFAKWYLTNENNFLLASGLYIAYIEFPELGKHKILKFAVIMKTPAPQYF